LDCIREQVRVDPDPVTVEAARRVYPRKRNNRRRSRPLLGWIEMSSAIARS
jgi:hypothetical protein